MNKDGIFEVAENGQIEINWECLEAILSVNEGGKQMLNAIRNDLAEGYSIQLMEVDSFYVKCISVSPNKNFIAILTWDKYINTNSFSWFNIGASDIKRISDFMVGSI